MLLVDALLRLPIVVGLLFIAVLLLRDQEWTLMTVIAASLAFSLSALFLSNAPTALALPFTPWVAAKVLAAPNLALLWWFGRALLDDNFQLGLFEWVVFLFLTLGNLPLLPEQIGLRSDWRDVAFSALALAVPVHLVCLAITGWRNDLIFQRRRFRLFLLGWLIIGLSIILLVEDANATEHIQSLVRMMLTFPVVWFVIFASTQMRPAIDLSKRRDKIWQTSEIGSAQSAALKRLMHTIETDLIYLDATLTLSALSKTCGVSEYQMRNLINGHLGFTNFPEFLNSYRINAAKRQLAHSNEQVTTIALDCGFKTLSTFNRAFKKIEGITPTTYRQNTRNANI